jgi:hypothetical protein
MAWLMNCMSGFLNCLCRLFGVTPEKVKQERDENPSPTREN